MQPTVEPAWKGVALITALVALVTVPALFTRDLWNPDEPRYMEVAREMVVRGEYVIPQLNGEVYSEKPPLFFWLAGLLWRAGLGTNAGRIVTVLAVWGTLLLIYFVCRAALGSRTALLATAMAFTSLLLLKFAEIGVLDPLLTLLVSVAVVLGWNALHRKAGPPALSWAGCYAAMGLGTLTKGPVGFLVPALILVAYGLANRKAVRAGGWTHLAGFALFAAIVGSWLVPAVLKGGPGYARTILVTQNVGRAVQSYSHRNPFHYYLVRWPAYFFPWSPLLPLAVWAAFCRRRPGQDVVLLGALWLVVPFVFFSLISGKRMNYVVPTTPAAGILLGWYLTGGLERGTKLMRAEQWLWRLSYGLTGLLAAGLMAAVMLLPAFVAGGYPEGTLIGRVAAVLTPARQAAAVAVLGVPLGLCLWQLGEANADNVRRAAVLIAAVVALSVAVELLVEPAANTVKSGRDFGRAVVERAGPQSPVFLYGDELSGVYNLWTGRVHMPVLKSEEEMRTALSAPGTFVIGDLKRFRGLLSPDELDRYTAHREQIGHRAMLLLQGRAPARQGRTAQGHGGF